MCSKVVHGAWMSCADLVAVSTYRLAAFVRYFVGLARLKLDYVGHLCVPLYPGRNWQLMSAHPKILQWQSWQRQTKSKLYVSMICLCDYPVMTFLLPKFCSWFFHMLVWLRGARMSQWWERSPPTSVEGVWFSRDGAVVRALVSHQCGPSLIPAWCHMWVEFVVSSRLAVRFFPRVLRFSSLHKNQPSNFQFDQDRGPAC